MVNNTTCIGNPVTLNFNSLPQVLPTTGRGGVSFTPQGRAAAEGYTKMPHMGSRESLDSTVSTISSQYSIGSTMSSTGKFLK